MAELSKGICDQVVGILEAPDLVSPKVAAGALAASELAQTARQHVSLPSDVVATELVGQLAKEIIWQRCVLVRNGYAKHRQRMKRKTPTRNLAPVDGPTGRRTGRLLHQTARKPAEREGYLAVEAVDGGEVILHMGGRAGHLAAKSRRKPAIEACRCAALIPSHDGSAHAAWHATLPALDKANSMAHAAGHSGPGTCRGCTSGMQVLGKPPRLLPGVGASALNGRGPPN